MSTSLLKSVLICICAASTALTAAPATIFNAVPDQSLFVVRVQNLEYTLGSIDQFLSGLSPMPIAVSMMGRMQIANALGDANLANINFRSDFAVFGLATGQVEPNSIPSVFIAAVLPVTDYSKMLAANPTASKPDANGISTVGPQKMLLAQANGYAIITQNQSYAQLQTALKSIKAKPLSARLTGKMPDPNDSVWAWADVQHVMKLYGPALSAQLDQAKAKMKHSDDPQFAAVQTWMNIYFDAIKSILSQTNDLSLALNFKPDHIALHKQVTPIPDSNFAKLLAKSSPSQVAGHPLMAYMPGSAIMSFSCQVDKPFTIEAYTQMIELFAPGFGQAFTKADQLKAIDMTRRSINSLGNTIAFSFSSAQGKTPPFNYTYILDVKDQASFKQTVDEGIEMVKLPAWQKFFTNLGMTLDYAKLPPETYKDTQVDVMSMKITATDPNSKMAPEFQKIYGENFLTKIAYVDNLAVMVAGGDVNDLLRSSVDKAKTKSAKTPEDIASSLALLKDVNKHQFVGTYNYIRLVQMMTSFAQAMPFPAEAIRHASTKSDIVFAGDITKSAISADIVIPKQHLIEIKTAIEMAMQQQQQRSIPEAPNGPAPAPPQTPAPEEPNNVEVQ